MARDFQRVAIVNRGEPAMRFIHAARELNREEGWGLRTIALYTRPDRQALYVREADEAYDLGEATFIDPVDNQRKVGYLDYRRLEEALTATAAEAAWVGWGFVAEHADFADLCERLGVVFIGPRGEVMRRLGDKIRGKHLAEKAKVPVAPWSRGPVASVEEARRHARRLGYPLMIKAAAGGGGRGIRRVLSADHLAESFQLARAEALKSFGDGTVFLERMLTGARHVEVQILADEAGTTWAVGVRDCTLQRRAQKVLEEAPSPALTAKQDRALRGAAARLTKAAGYTNAGTVEFLYDPVAETFAFMEVNARLQVEHPVTELTTGLDLVKLQLRIARGDRLEGKPPPPHGHAIEVRLNAEDPDNAFAPAPGRVELLRWPTGPGVRVDTGVAEGDEVASEFDSMIAKVLAHGRDRPEALARLRRALADLAVVLRGGTTNKAFLLELLARPEVASSEVDIGWLDALVRAGEHTARPFAEVALLVAAVEAYEAEIDIEKSRFFAAAARGRPQVSPTVGRRVELAYRGNGYELAVCRLGPRQYAVVAEGRRVDLEVERLGRRERRLLVGGERHRVLAVVRELDMLVEIDGIPHKVSRDHGGAVRAPSPAVVVSLDVAEGDEVTVGQRLAVLEAMKMEMPVNATAAGVVRRVLVRSHQQVGTGEALMLLDAAADPGTAPAVPRMSFAGVAAAPAVGTDAAASCRHHFAELRRLVLGYDVGGGDLDRLVAAQGAICEGVPPDDPEMWRREREVLTIFVDVCSLFRSQPEKEGEGAGRSSYRELLNAYLRDLDAQGEHLPGGFLARLKAALARYGVEELGRSPELEESLFRLYRAHQGIEGQVAPALALLERWLDACEVLRPRADEGLRQLLEGLMAETRERFPEIHACAREVRYRYFDQPVLEQVSRRLYAEAEEDLAGLARHLKRSEREERIEALVECTQPLTTFFASRFRKARRALRQAMLEVLLRRYYRFRELRQITSGRIKGVDYAGAEYDFEGRRIHVFAAHASEDRLGQAVKALRPLIDPIPPEHEVVVDFYLWRPQTAPDPEEARRGLEAALADVAFGRPIRHVTVALASPYGGLGKGGNQHFTFRPAPGGGFREERLYRGLHPLISTRLQLWRLSNFDLERLPSPEDVFLLRAVARENPGDERLIALAEVRDMTPLRDEEGRIVALPQLEWMLMEALAGIRRFQSHRPVHERLHWNRVLLYVWPPVGMAADELNALVERLAPEARGLGLEKVVVRARVPDPRSGELRDTVLEVSRPAGAPVLRLRRPAERPIRPVTEYKQRVTRLRQRGLLYPYEAVRILTPERVGVRGALPPGDFREHDLDADGRLVPVVRPPGENRANVVVGVVRNFTAKVPEGMARVILLGDPSRGMGSLAEPECRRIVAAIDLAAERGVPLEWFAVSAGATISMESGTENMDWIARVLRRLVEFTQAGGEVNLVVAGVNVGAQPYWNAEATMLEHTRGILVMTPDGAMVLTGKQALDYSGGVSAEDNQGIGGYERIMGPNGQAQYFARDFSEACQILLRHYEHAYVVPGERFPRRAATADPADRDVGLSPHGAIGGADFERVGDVFSPIANPGRKRPFDVRKVMAATVDQDLGYLERWFVMRDAETAVVWDAHLGGYPVCLVAFESRPLPRLGFVPADGPEQWTAGTLFPLSSKKVARALNSASGNRPAVILANLSGFDGSPESMRKLQLEYGAEIGRAVVNFQGPIVFCVISRYHGGAFVVFSNALNDNLEVAALEGAYASVIGGAPAAAVVFAREVDRRTEADPRLTELDGEIAAAEGADKVRLQARRRELYQQVYAEKLGEVGEEFDRVHSIQRAQRVGSVHQIIAPARLRPYLIEAVERGIARELARWGEAAATP
jgi:acetyl/propionyl-CoA carboxylase alpha subunit/acetyl-CoA carboxylase carboxyltransferase component